MASRWVKWVLRISAGVAGIVVLCVIALIAFILFEAGLRWPTVQHVDQGPWADTLYIKAEDFLDDSGYVVRTDYESCCSDKGLCRWPLQNSEIFRLTKAHAFVAVPLQWLHRSMCPYRLSILILKVPGNDVSCSFSPDTTGEAPFPKVLDVACLRADQEDTALHSLTNSKWHSRCSETLFSLPTNKDTLFVQRGGL